MNVLLQTPLTNKMHYALHEIPFVHKLLILLIVVWITKYFVSIKNPSSSLTFMYFAYEQDL